MLSPKLAETLNQPIVIDNRGGAAGNIGAEIAKWGPVVRAVGVKVD